MWRKMGSDGLKMPGGSFKRQKLYQAEEIAGRAPPPCSANVSIAAWNP